MIGENMDYSMKDVCQQTGIRYETLKFYCNEGLVPNVKRDHKNYRIFCEHDIAWIESLQRLRRCGMSLKDMKTYMSLCLDGPQTIQIRQRMLEKTRERLVNQLEEISECIVYIDEKQDYFNDVLNDTAPYTCNLIELYYKQTDR